MESIYDGQVFGIFEPLKVSDEADAVVVKGGTFAIKVSKASGQIVSATVEGTEFIAPGSCMPNPYVGIFPENEPGATPLGGKDRPRFAHELAAEIHPKLFSGGLTASRRHDAVDRPAESVKVISAECDRVMICARGRYGDTPLTWEIDYDVDVDGFTKVTVRTRTSKSLMLRWHCFNHVSIDAKPVEFLVPWADVGVAQVAGFGPHPTRTVTGARPGDLVFGAHLNPFFHLGNPATGIEFSKQDFGDRYAGYRDSATILEDGTKVDTDTVETEDGRAIRGADSRGRRRHFTQLYRGEGGYELEEFDVRNTTYPLNPDRGRERSFWFQLTPCKRPRRELNSLRVVWPGPHQMKMVRWSGLTEPWAPPTDEQVKLWAQLGVNLIIGGANYFSGEFSRPTEPEKIRHFLDTAHSYGMKVLPYVTFSDFNFVSPGYQSHAADWMASAAIEYKLETTLMCFGAEGWREHFEREVDALLSQFKFDGLYIDHWSNTRVCWNERHGCRGYMMRFVTEGYHDIARRARRVVAKHTKGKGLMLLNTGDDIFSGVLSMFDIRLIGENIDPRKVPELTLRSSYDPERQGIAALAYPSRFGGDVSFINFAVSFALSARLQVVPKSIDEWRDDCPGRPSEEYKRYWDIWRAFNVNRASRVSPFRAERIARVRHPEGRVSLYVGEGRVLAVIGLVNVIRLEDRREEVEAQCRELAAAMARAGLKPGLADSLVEELRVHVNPAGAAAAALSPPSPPGGEGGVGASREGGAKEAQVDRRVIPDVLEILDPAALGLSEAGDWRVQDLVQHGYVECESDRRIPVTLAGSRPQVLLIEPRRRAPALAHFTGVDAARVAVKGGTMTVSVEGVEGAPLDLYVDAGGKAVRCDEPGFAAEPLETGLVRVSGFVNASRTVNLKIN